MEQRPHRDETARTAASVAVVAALYDAHVDDVYRFVYRRCRDHSLAEDISQETFVIAIRTSDDPERISVGWLLTVARNRLIDVLRREASYEGKLQLVAQDDRQPDLDAELVERLRIEGALNQMRVEYRLVLTLHYIDGLTVSALADHLGRSKKSIEGLVTRARRELRALLASDVPSPRAIGDTRG